MSVTEQPTTTLDVERLALALRVRRRATIVRHGNGASIPGDEQDRLLDEWDRTDAGAIAAEYAHLEQQQHD